MKAGLPTASRGLVRLLVFLAGVCAIAYAQWRWTGLHLAQGLVPMLLGIAAVAFSRAPLDPVAADGVPRRPPPFAEACFLIAVVAAAACVRFIGLDHIPPGGFFDEIQNYQVAEGILKGDRPVFIAEMTQMPALFFYVLAGAIAIAGKGLATVRGLSALLGTLTVPGFYFLARRAFSWPVAAATTILLAGSRWHVTFSRFGLATILGPLLEVLAVLCLWKAMETRRRVFFLLFGAVVGVGLQAYYSFNVFPAVLAAAVTAFSARQGWKSFGSELRPILRGLAWSVLMAVILLLPLARFAVRHPKVFFERSNRVAIWNPEHHLPWPGVLWTNSATNLLMFNYRGDANPRHNIPEVPMLNPAEGALLVLGLGAALSRGWKWPQATWLVWFFAMLLPAILTIEAPQAHRALGAVPAVYLLIGQGLQPLFAYATHSAGRIRRAAVAVVLFAASLAATSRDLTLYFGPQVHTSLAWREFQADHHAIGRFLKPFGNRFDIFVSPLYFKYNIERFYLGPDFPCEPFRLFEHLPISPGRIHGDRDGLLYVLEPFQEGLFPLFHDLYPHSRMEAHRDPYGRTMFVEIRVPREDLGKPPDPRISRMGFLGAYWQNEAWAGQPTILRREPAIWFHSHWYEDPLPHPFTAEWTASLQIDEPGEYAFDLATSGPTVLSLDGQKVLDTAIDSSDPQQATVALSRGRHLLAVGYWEKSFRGTITLAWQPPHGKSEVIPLNVLTPLSVPEYMRLRNGLPRPSKGE